MTEMLLTARPPEQRPEDSYNHFDATPWKLFHDDLERRNEENPDLVLLLAGFGDAIRETRLSYDRYIASKSNIQRQFYDSIPEGDVHSTIHRVNLLADITEDHLTELVANLRSEFADFDPVTLRFAEKWEVGDAIISELTSEGNVNPVRIMRSMASQALMAAGLQACKGDFTPHSSDRYAKELDQSRREEICAFLSQSGIDPAEFNVPGIFVAVNWPERDNTKNFGTYKYKVIEFIPFAGIDKDTGLSVVRNKLIMP